MGKLTKEQKEVLENLRDLCNEALQRGSVDGLEVLVRRG